MELDGSGQAVDVNRVVCLLCPRHAKTVTQTKTPTTVKQSKHQEQYSESLGSEEQKKQVKQSIIEVFGQLLLARAFTNAKSHECTLENLDYYSTSVPPVRPTHNLRLAVVMLSTLLDKLRALSAQSALEYGPAHLRASEFQE